jgi:hypothetical protein
MEALQSINVSIPLWQVIMLGLIALACIISARLKLGLVATFSIALYWSLMKQFPQGGSSIMNLQFFDVFCLFIGFSLAAVFIIYLFFMASE